MAREQRRLAAIVAADVVGYSRLMGRDESGTLARLREHRKQRFEPTLVRHGGRLVKLTGDGVLAEFPSAVDALGAAIEFQQAMAEANHGHTEDVAIVFRVGLHLGDLIVDGADLYGDGVNVAARLEAEALPGSIVISRTVHEAVVGRLKATFTDLGSLALKNIERPVQAFGVKWDAADWKIAAPAAASPVASSQADDVPLTLPDKPSIAVLPFQNMSGDPEQEYFADGISEDVITALSRSRDFLVTARNSTFTYKGTSPDIRQVGRDLGVRYVLEGSVRKSGDRLRITAQLIDATSGNHVWAERYDRPTADIFAVQDEITESVVASIEPQLLLAEGGRHKRSQPTDLDAWGYVARAFAHRVLANKAEAEVALGFLKRALEIDPQYARALSEFALLMSLMAYSGWCEDRDRSFAAGIDAARRATALDPDDPFAYAALGVICRLTRRYDEALPALRTAVELNPNYAFAHAHLGISLAYAGRPEEGLEHTARALRVSPRDPQKHLLLMSQAIVFFAASRYSDAFEWARQARQQRAEFANPLRVMVAALALQGDVEQAQVALRDLKRIQPQVSLAWVDQNIDAPDEHRRRILDGLRLAGLQ